MKERMNVSFLLFNTLGFLLLLEWIWPLGVLSGTAEIWVFLVFLSVCFILTFFRSPFILNVCIKSILIVVLLYSLYFEERFFQFEWMAAFGSEMESNLRLLISGNWVGLTHMFRSLLFFILLGFMVYLLQYWLNYRKKIFILFLLTTVYIAFLDTFTAYDGSWAIIRTVIIGFVLMGSLTFQRIFKRGNLDFQAKVTRKWLISLLVMLILSASFGYGLPKADPIWPDPLSYIEGIGEGYGNPGSKRVGYGMDDRLLGGSLAGDSSVVFRSRVESSHYWKVETKDVYTGRDGFNHKKNWNLLSFYRKMRCQLSLLLKMEPLRKQNKLVTFGKSKSIHM